MPPIVSFAVTLGILGVTFALIHWVALWLGLPDLVSLLLFAIPIVAYIAYCTQESRALWLRSALTMYSSFAGVVLAAAGLVYLIG